MSKYKVVTVVATLLLVVILLTIVKFFTNGKGGLISPGIGKLPSQLANTPAPVISSQAPAYNPPKEINYNSSTDLKQELETVNPEVLESDFE